jgi:inner membrane protein
MDLLSHGLVGAATALAGSKPNEARLAAGVGFAAALLADVDTLFRSAHDPLMVLEWHRHFTHALIFIPAGALIAALLLWPFMRTRLPFLRLYRYTFLGYALAGLLDACTSYGTHLLWPFSAERTAWSIISVLDPLFTLVVLIPTIAAFTRRSPAFGGLALAVAAAYLGLGTVQHQRALTAAEGLAESRGISASRIEVKPTLGNLLLWRSMAVADDTIHVDAVRVGLMAETRHYAGTSGELVDPALAHWLPRGSTARRDLERFAYFSEDLLARHPEEPHRVGDARYAMLPNSLRPIWSIRLDPQRPEEHVELVVDRGMTPALRQCFIDMLLGREMQCPP